MAQIDLTYLREYSDNDIDFIRDMIELYLENIPESLESIENSLKAQEYAEIASSAHKIKPSMIFMGLSSAKDLCIEIENLAKNQPFSEELGDKIKSLKAICDESYGQLRKELETL